MPTKLSARSTYTLAAAGGSILWMGATLLSGRREAWDSSLYWAAAYPAGIALGCLLGFLTSERPWRWGLTLMIAQAVTLAAMTLEFGLLPLGLVLFAVLAVPPMLAAGAGAWLRSRFSSAS